VTVCERLRCWADIAERSMARLHVATIVAILGVSTVSGCGAFTGPGDLVVEKPGEAVLAARQMLAEQQSDPTRHKGWLKEAELPPSLRIPGLHHASVHGDHIDLVLARNPDYQVGGRIWAKAHREHQDRPTEYPEIFFFSYTNDSPESAANIE
jgi:hypothetical protein